MPVCDSCNRPVCGVGDLVVDMVVHLPMPNGDVDVARVKFATCYTAEARPDLPQPRPELANILYDLGWGMDERRMWTCWKKTVLNCGGIKRFKIVMDPFSLD